MGVYFGPPYDDYSAMRGPCLEGYHVPIDSERQSLIDILTTTFGLAQNGTTVKTYLKMPYAGYLAPKTGGKSSQGTVGYYWTCIGLSYNAYFITFNDSTLNVTSNPNTPGYNVRPFKDVPIKPDNNWAVLYDGSSVAIGAGIYHNSTLGLISISGDGKSWATIADKNLGATIVYDSGDTLSESNCGGYFQWGNNYTFPFTGAVTTSSTKVDASAYGPGNYYSSSTFIKVSTKASRNSTNNINLRGGETGVVLKRELKNAYIGEYIPTSGLLGYRPLQSDLKDASGNGKDGSRYSGTGSFGTIGGKTGAVVTKISHVGYNDHDTTKQHIVTTLNYSGPTVTICGWIYYNSMNSGLWNGILTNTSSNTNFISMSPRPAQSNRWTVGGGGNLLTVNTSASVGTWHFVCGVLTSSGKKVYLNGSLIGSDNTGFTTGQGSIWRLGCGQINSGTNMATAGGTDGYIRHCAVYNRELTADEILKYYNITA